MRYEVLGAVQARVGSDRLALGGTQQRRLLAVLLLSRDHVISLDRLIDALWPDGNPPMGASRAILTYISRLRSCIDTDSITTEGGGYMLRTGASTIDAVEFEQLVQRARTAAPDQALGLYGEAVTLWRGRAFGEFVNEWWAVAEATRLEELHTAAREERAQACIAMGQAGIVIPELEALFVEFPGRDGIASALMQALDAVGRKAEALRVFRVHRTQLVEQSGLDPSSMLIRLERSILADDVSPLAAGRPLRGYVLHEAIGRGTHGTVYAARQPGTERDVAIKVIRSELADSPEFVRRFEREAQLIARLEHPHIVPLYDFWREPGGAYLVFRLLRGGTAEESMISGGRWSLDTVGRLVEQVGSAVITAHAAGVIHGDLRPSNILLDTKGNMFVSDFGIASESPAGTDEGVQVDIADLATTVWELLAGSPAVMSTWRSSLPSLLDRLPELAPGVDAVLGRATLPRNHPDRFDSMADFVLAWRATVGPSAATLEIGDRRRTSSDRRLAARELTVRAASNINPYCGLRPFAESDARDFFGRAELTAALCAAVERSRFVAVVGASGLGKSSLVHAGMVPIARESARQIAWFTPGENPWAALHAALNEIALVALDPQDLSGAIGVVAEQSSTGLLMLIDQFEECWTLMAEQKRDAFIDLVVSCIETEGAAPVSVVVTLRADMYDRPLVHPRLGPLIADGTFPVTPMRAAELEEAIRLPAARAHVEFADGVVSSMVTEAVANPASLPLLQFTLYELFERRVDGMVTSAAYDAIGGIAGATASRAEQLFDDLSPTQQNQARRLFGRLVAPGDGLPDSRRRCLHGELPAEVLVIAERFVEARLLAADHDPVTREPTIELAHESLLTNWSRLASWVADDRRWLAQLQHLSVAARAWDQSDQEGEELYRGSRLEAALEEMPTRRDDLTDTEVAFIEAGQRARDIAAARDRRSVRRLRRLLLAVAVMLLVAIGSGAIAVVQRRAADRTSRQARVDALVGEIGTVRATRRDTAALLAIEAFRLADTPSTRSALFSTFTTSPGFLDLHRVDGGAEDFAGIVVPASGRAFIVDGDNRLRPYDPDTGRTGSPFESVIPDRRTADLTGTPGNPAAPHVASLAASADGRRVAQVDGILEPSGGATTTIAVFDAATGSLVADPVESHVSAGTAVLDRSGTRLVASGGSDGSVVAVDLTTGRQTGQLDGLAPPEQLSNEVWRTAGLAFLDDHTLAVGSVADEVRLVDPSTLESTSEPIIVPTNTTNTLVAIDDGKRLLGSGLYGIVLIDVVGRSVVWSTDTRGSSPGACSKMTVVPERSTFYCFDSFGRLEERDLLGGSRLRELDAQNGNVGSAWATRNGSELVVFSAASPLVARWRLDGSGPVTRRIGADLVPSQYSPDGRQLIAAEASGIFLNDFIPGTSVILDSATGVTVAPLSPLEFGFWDDDETIAGVIPTEEGFQLAHYHLRSRQVAPTDYTFTVQLDRNITNPGQPRAWVSTPIGDNTWEIWTFARPSGTRIAPTITIDSLINISGSPRGHRLAASTTTGVVLYDADDGAELARLGPRDDLRGVFFVTDELLAITSVSGELALYDADTLASVRSLNGSRGFIEDVQASLDGSMVAVRGGDRNVQLIDVTDATPIGGPITIPFDERRGIVLQPDGSELAVGGGGSAGIAVWELDPASWVAAACRVAGRNLTVDEWDRYIGTLAPYHETCTP